MKTREVVGVLIIFAFMAICIALWIPLLAKADCGEPFTYTSSEKGSFYCRDCVCVPVYPTLHEGDEGLCGLYPFETGTWDASWKVCRRHDAMTQGQADGVPQETILETQGKFFFGELGVALTALVTIPAALAYAFIGVGVSTPMQIWRKIRK